MCMCPATDCPSIQGVSCEIVSTMNLESLEMSVVFIYV